MAHQITIREDGKAEMAYLEGVYCWHGLGNELQPGATIEEWIVAAGMDWRALRATARYYVDREKTDLRSSEGDQIFFRSDTKEAIGRGSDKFQLVQPREVLEFFRDLVGSVGFRLTTAGTLFGGSKFWAMSSSNREAFVVDKRDTVKANLLVATAIDGSMKSRAKHVATQVVCNNTLTYGLQENGGEVAVSHRTKFDPVAVKRELGIEAAMSSFDATIERMKKMGETRLSYEATILATANLFYPDFANLDGERRDKILRTKPVEPVARMACDNDTLHHEMDGVNGTVYGWLNAVTEYVDHQAVTRGDWKVDNRLDSSLFGRGATIKGRAFEMATAAIGPGSASRIAISNAGLLNTVVDAPQGAPQGISLEDVLDNTPT